MKKFHFSLEKLRGYKEQLLDAERAVLADMNGRLNQLEQELEDLRGELMRSSADLNQRYAEGITPMEIMQHKIYLDSLGQAVIQKEREIFMQKQAIDRQMDKVRTAKIELSTIEKLREKKLEEYTYLENKATEQFIEEFVSTQKAMALQS